MSQLITIDPEKCVRCSLCSRVCPMQIKTFEEALNSKTGQLKNTDCIKCEICVKNCPVNALSLRKISKKEIPRLNPETNIVEIISINNLSRNVKEFEIKFDKDMEFIPGDYILIKVGDCELNVLRAYSIARIINKRQISIAVKLVEGGIATKELFKLKKGETLEVKGPIKGKLRLDSKEDLFIFVGIGVGITPFVSLVKEAIKLKKKVILFHGARYKKDLIYNDLFKKVKNKNFKYIDSITKEDFGRVGRIQKFIEIEKLNPKSVAYLCGHKKGLQDIKKILNKNKITKIFEESF